MRLPKPFFMKKVQPAVDAIDTRIETLKKEVADLEGRRERLLASIGGSSPLSLGFVDVVPFLFFSFFFFFSFPSLTTPPSTLHLYSSFYNTYLASLTSCHSLGL